MAFINEKLTSDQQQEVNSWEIRYPRCSMGQILKYAKLENPWYWTIGGADGPTSIFIAGKIGAPMCGAIIVGIAVFVIGLLLVLLKKKQDH